VVYFDENRVRILPPPSANLRDASGESAAIGRSVVVSRRQDMAVQIGSMQDRDANCVTIERGNSTRQSWRRGDQSRLPDQLQKIAARPGFILMEHRGNGFVR